MTDRNRTISNEMNFSYIDDRVAGCIGPLFPEHLDFLKRQGVTGLVRMAEGDTAAFDSDQIVAFGFDDCHMPVRDWTAPRQKQIDTMLRFVRAVLARGGKVAITCGAGKGRTGTLLACHLVTLGMDADQAISIVRSKRPGSVETASQRAAVLKFEQRCRNREGVL